MCSSDLGRDETEVFELAICLEHGVGVDRESLDDLLDGRQLITGFQQPQPQGLTDLLHHLLVRRDPRARVEMELDHDASPRSALRGFI